MKTQENEVQGTEAKDKDKAFVEEEVVTKYVEDEVGNSTFQHTCHKFETSRER